MLLPADRGPGFVTLTAAAHPFRVSRDVVMVREGQSLAEMLREAQPDPILARHAVIFIAGHRIRRAHWSLVYPKAGAHVEIRVLPSGGGGGGGGQKNVMRSVMMIAVMAAAIVVAPYLAPALVGATGLSLATATTLITAGVGLVGSLAVSALVPVRPPKLGRRDEAAVFGIEGARNRGAPFQAVPQILGRHRIAPNYGAAPYTEIVGGEQYLRLLFVWGVGPLAIDESSLKIGETALAEFDGVEIEHRAGHATDAPLTLYPGTVTEDGLQILLFDGTNGTGMTGPQLRTSAADADELSVDLAWPGGLYYGENSGGTGAATATVRVRYRAVGGGAWLTPAAFTAKTFPDDWITGAEIEFLHAQRTAVRHGMRWAVPRGQYEVEVECTGGNEDHRGANGTYWTALRTFTDEDPIQSRVPVAKTALRIKATDQLNGVVDELTGIVTTIGKHWTGTAWVDDQEITNPAALFRHILQGGANAAPLPDSRIDLARLEDWHEFCESHDFTFSQVRTGGSVWDALADCAGAGRASPAEPDGKWGVVVDRPQAVAVSHITPRNSSGFSVEKAFIELPHAFRISFPNEAEGYRLDERRIYRDGYNAGNATRFEAMEIPGVTDPDQIFTLGRYRLAQGIHQPERWSFRQDMEYLTYQRGDRVKITHDVLLVGLASGRVESVAINASNEVMALTLDEAVTMEASKGYGIAVRTLSGSITGQVVTVAGEQTTVTFSTPVPAVSGQPAIGRGDLFGFGLLGAETDDALVIAIQPANDFRARVTAVPYRGAVYGADEEAIPPFDTNLTPLAELTAPDITSVVSDESALAYGPDGSLRTRIMIDFRRPGVARQLPGFRIVARVRTNGTGEAWRVAPVDERSDHHIIIGGVDDGSVWDIRLWFEAEGRLPGPASTIIGHTVAGKTAPPSPVTGAQAWGDVHSVHLSWDEHPQADFGHVRIETTAGAAYTSPTIVGSSAGTSFTIANVAVGTTVNVWLIAVDTSGNASAPVGPYQATATGVQAGDLGPDTVDTENLVDGAVIGQKIAEASISVRHEVATARGRALNPDPFFMEGAGLFNSVGGITFPNITNGKVGRIAARRGTTGGASLYSDGVEAQRVPYDPERTYSFSLWARRFGAGADGLLYGVMRAIDANGDLITDGTGVTGFSFASNNLYAPAAEPVGNGWSHYEQQFGAGTGYSPPTGTKFLTVGALINLGATAGTMDVQDLRIEQVIRSGDLVDGAVIAAKIADNAVEVDKLADLAVTAEKVAANAITTTKIADEAIAAGKIAANAVGEAHIQNLAVSADKVKAGAIITDKIADDAITTGKLLAGAVTTQKLDAGAVNADKLAANAVTAVKIDAGAVTTAKLDAEAVTAAKIDAGSVTAGKIAAGAVTATKIDAGAVETEKLAANAVTTAKLNAGAVIADKIASGAVTAIKLDAGAVTTNKLAAGAVETDKLDANAVTTDKLAANSVDAGKIVANSITGDRLAANTISARNMVVTNRGQALNPDPYFRDPSIWSSAGLTFDTTATGKVSPHQVRGGPGTTTLRSSDYEEQWVAYDAEKVYRFSGWVRKSPASNGAFYGIMQFRDSSGNLLTRSDPGASWASGNDGANYFYDPVNMTLPAGGGWAYFEVIFGKGQTATPPTAAVEMCLGALLDYQNTAGTGTTHAQGFILEEMVDSSLVVDGDILGRHIAANAIETEHLAANSITSSEIAAGAVTADKVSVTDLSAISADLGTIKVGSANFADTIASSNFSAGSAGWQIQQDGSAEFNELVVRTDMIDENAVTESGAEYSETSTAIGTSWQTILSETINPAASMPVYLSFDIEFEFVNELYTPTLPSFDTGNDLEIRIRRGSTVLQGARVVGGYHQLKEGIPERFFTEGARTGHFSIPFVDLNPPSGSQSYSVQARKVVAPNGDLARESEFDPYDTELIPTITRRCLFVLQTKR